MPIKRLRNGIFVKSNTKRFTEITNCNLSQRLVELTLLFFNDVEEHEFLSMGLLVDISISAQARIEKSVKKWPKKTNSKFSIKAKSGWFY